MSQAIVTRVNGPVVEIAGGERLAMLDLVEVGPHGLPGEVIALGGDGATVQVYEYTGGLKPGDDVVATGGPLRVPLQPGLLGGVFDGMLRPLSGAGARLAAGAGRAGAESGRGRAARERRWRFVPEAAPGTRISAGAQLGTVAETPAIDHHPLVPPGTAGPLEWIAPEGNYALGDTIARVGGRPVELGHHWPPRRPRPVRERLPFSDPLVTGQRVLDLLFPVARGSTAVVPGGFGTGKTVTLQEIAKWCDARVIVYVGCGERGNELADVLEQFRGLEDPVTGQALLARTVIIANTSNMPVMAREASVYTGVAVAEFYRDMGYDTVVIADSTSRWAEALRELAARTGELPAEEGYPAGLSSALAAFYERAGRVRTLGGEIASVTILGAVSPPGGDLAEPVTSHTRRFVRSVWSLDRDLAYSRHYPAVSWRDSSSRDADQLGRWQAGHGDPGWAERRERALRLLGDSDRIESLAQLVGLGSLPPRERLTLHVARLLGEVVLQQSASRPADAFCAPGKQRALLELVLDVLDRLTERLDAGVDVAALEAFDLSPAIRARVETGPGGADAVDAIRSELAAAIEGLA